MIDGKELNNYTNNLREAYKIYHNALIRYGETLQDKEGEKIRLIRSLKDPEHASLGYMITIGILGTRLDYEVFFAIGKDGIPVKEQPEMAIQELKKLTYSNKDPEIKKLIAMVNDSINFMEEIWKNNK
jgi:hypothetical protein